MHPSLPLPGLDNLLAVLRSHGQAIDLRPVTTEPLLAGDLVLGEPFDPMLAELYSRFDGGRLGELYISSFNLHRDSLVPLNERARERAETRIKKLLCYAQIGGLAESFATVPSLAAPGGLQPVVYFQSYMDKTILPFGSNVDRAFALYARYCDERISACGSLLDEPPMGHSAILFPDSYVEQVAQDEPLVRMLREGRFDELALPDEGSQEWVQNVLSAAR